MRLFRRHRTQPDAEAAPARPPQPEVADAEVTAASSTPQAPARAKQVVTGPPPLRTPQPSSAPPVATEPEAQPDASQPATDPALSAASRAPDPPPPTRRWHLAAAEMRVPVGSSTLRRATPREHHHGRWHQV